MSMGMGSTKGELLAKHGLTGPQMKILYMIYFSNPATTSALAQDMNISNAAVTQLVDKLIQQDYLQRSESLVDRRVTWLNFTTLGKLKFQMFQVDHMTHMQYWTDRLSTPEFQTLVYLQTKMLDTKT